jgi:hypothetical protein
MSAFSPHRRQLLLGALALAVWPRRVRAGGKKVLLVGDSMIATALGQHLEKGLAEEGFSVQRRGKSSSGLARPDFFDWQAEATRLVEKHAPDAVVVMMGGNDAQSLKTGAGWIKWGTEEWRTEYARRIEGLLDTLAVDGRPVCWIGLPIVRSPGYRRKIQLINELVAQAVDGRAGCRFLSTWDVLAQAGDYAHTMTVGGREETVRGDDGVHLTVAGARLMERKVRPDLVAALTG